MKRSSSVPWTQNREESVRSARSFSHFWCLAGLCALTATMAAAPATAQVITIDTHGNATTGHSGTVDRRFAQIKPTDIPLPKSELDAKSRLDLVRFLEADQGFAMRPFPRGHKGLTLVANGMMEPAGESYLAMVTANGLSAKPGDRLVLSDVKIDKSKIVFQVNGGPDAKHRFLRHIQIGMGGPDMTNPVVADDQEGPTGARLTLTFPKGVPRTDRKGSGGTSVPTDFVRGEDAHPGIYRHAAAKTEGSHTRSSCDGGDEHGHGAIRPGSAGAEDA